MSAAPIKIRAEFYPADVLDFQRALERHRVRHVIVGGEAAIFHGYPRLTGEIDFFSIRKSPIAGACLPHYQNLGQGKFPASKRLQNYRNKA